jgi:hypothetical protein
LGKKLGKYRGFPKIQVLGKALYAILTFFIYQIILTKDFQGRVMRFVDAQIPTGGIARDSKHRLKMVF